MSVYLKSIEAKNLFNEKNINWNLTDVSVLVGKNGAGKTTILRSVYELMTEGKHDALNLSTEFTINFINKASIKFKKSNTFSNKEISIFLDLLEKSRLLLQKNKVSSKSRAEMSSKKKKVELEIENFHNLYEELNLKKKNVSSMFLSEIAKENNDFISEISVEMISTINMSANSINELTKSDGNTTTLLDLELNAEMDKLRLAEDNNEFKLRKTKFIAELDAFFRESNKSVSFDGERIIIKNKKTDKDIQIGQLSSGERQLLFILIKALNMSSGKNILLMDEPEISLHMSWQKKLISSIKNINDKCQIIIVTHSASIVAKGWLDSFVDIKNIESEVL
ncbi:AAA family ATPase [Klebsiella variicola]|uniref:AAA family ATPase n=1 Tax=Klebsiella variicola TaxID=244366 RepID=UPI0038727C01